MRFLLKVIRRLILVWTKGTKRFFLWYYQVKMVKGARLNGGTVAMPRSCNLVVPVCCNGLGSVILGEHVALGFQKGPTIGVGTIILQARKRDASISIGAGTSMSNNICMIASSKISLGKSCQIGDQVAIYDCDFHEINPETRNASEGEILPVEIGNNVWLGSRVMILKGVTIGDHCVIAAGAIVTKSFSSRSLVAGIPAKFIRKI